MTSDPSEKRAPSLWLWLATMCALFSAMSMGVVLGWSSPALPSMGNSDSEPHLDDKEDESIKSWIGSSLNLGALVGGLSGGPLNGFFGMKKCLIGLGIPFVAGWACILFTKAVPLMLVGRVLTGLAAGIACGVAPTYVNHISTPNIRGLLGTGFQIFVNIGILYSALFGIGLSWRWLCLPAIIPPILMSVGMLFMPESPIWLMTKYGRSSQVVDALRVLRSSDSDIEGELKEIQERVDADKETSTGFSFSQLKRADVYKPLIIANALMVFQQLSGVNAVLFYAADIFKSAGSKIDPNVNAVIINSAMVIAVIIGGLIIDKLGRRLLLLISGSGHIISLVLIGYYFFNANKECPSDEHACSSNTTTTMAPTPLTTISVVISTVNGTGCPLTECTPTLGWLPVISLVGFVIFFSLGFGPIPWMIVAEITPGYALSFISSLATFVNWLFAFIVTFGFKSIQAPNALNKHGAFWLFAGICAASVVFTFLFIPESKGKSHEEMSRIFLGQQNVRNDGKQNGNKVVSTI